jgi:transcriptional regulator with XRE-family HTH domain
MDAADDRSADRAGLIVRAEREKRCLSQSELAARAGVSKATEDR